VEENARRNREGIQERIVLFATWELGVGSWELTSI
jgi:hypothetical protein